jgi:hypothetical protein
MQQGAIITPEVEEFLTGLLKYQWIKNIYRFFCLIGNIIGFFLNGHAIVALGYWVVMVAGRISESALLFATLWITADNVASDFMTKVVGGSQNANMLTNLSILAFSLLPEVMVFSAIVITYEHWHSFFRDRRGVNPSWVWGILYTAPTLTFLTMTVATLGSFVASDTHTTPHATGLALVIRCLAGWSYSIIGLIYSRIGKRPLPQTGQQNSTVQIPDYSQMIDDLRTQIQADFVSRLSRLSSDLRAQIDSKIVAPEPLDYVALTASIMPVIEAKLSEVQTTLNARIPTPVDLGQLAIEVAAHLQTREVQSELDGGTTEGTNTPVEHELPRELDREQEGEVTTHEQIPLHIVPRQTKGGSTEGTRRGNTMGNSEATKTIHRLLKKDSALGPTELAEKAGCSKRHASTIKRQYLASQQVS